MKTYLWTFLALLGAFAVLKFLLRNDPTPAEVSIMESNAARADKSVSNAQIRTAPVLAVVGNPGQIDASPWAVVRQTSAVLFPSSLS
jgi:hypothetical protein